MSFLLATLLTMSLSARVGIGQLTVRVTLHIDQAIREDSEVCFQIEGDSESASCWPPQDKRTWERLITLPTGQYQFVGQVRWKDSEDKSHVEFTPHVSVEVS